MKKYVIRTKHLFLKAVSMQLAVCLFSLPVFAGEPKPSGFMNSKNMGFRGDLPFEMSWIKPGVPWSKYRKVVIAPVDTQYLMKSDFWQEMGRSGEIQKDVDKLAKYTRLVFEQAFFTDPKKRFKVTYSLAPDPSVLKVEMALTELTPNKVMLKAAGYVPIFGWLAKAVNLTNRSHVAIEIRLRDSLAGETLAKFVDRKSEPFTIVHMDQFNWYGFAEKRVDQWAVKLVETLNRRPGEVVERSSNFELSPW